MPGRRTPPMPDRLSPQWWISALTSVPVQLPAPGCTTRPGRLVDDDQLVVLVEHIERDVLALRLRRLRFGHVDRHAFAGGILRLVSSTGLPSTADRALPDQHLHAAARHVRAEAGRQPLVEALAGRIRACHQHGWLHASINSGVSSL